MTNFIKLSSIVINKNFIKNVILSPGKYSIYFNNFVSSGFIESTNDKIHIYKELSPKDYQIISKWIENIDNEFDCTKWL